ncbi:flagellar motor protein MotB [Bacillus sp. AGMB 02131]|uniref:Flagellar motor protein MotB n=1 Tax=Peribacillus faecalis TaxID=2772559 RepID=A0A927HBR0_9BACI|nr:flagellar motor protein MotB [Peribacillus faecalis]MBD3108771.1 flagellar motor protein MotB [Peribacillus faecalis]
MARRRKKKHHEEHINESWLLPYADILTLLLALFIVLFAMSSVDATKFQQLSKSFNDVFAGGTGVLEFSSPIDGSSPPSKDNEGALVDREKGNGKLEEKDQQELAELQEKVNQYIEESNLTEVLDTKLTGEGLLVVIRDNVLFESGSADIRVQDMHIAREISDLIVMDLPRSIIVSGHTDNIPISNSQFASNWDLSVLRAVNFMKILLDNNQLNPEWFSAKGYGEFKPVASNETEDGRAKNRRVEILIAPRTQLDM